MLLQIRSVSQLNAACVLTPRIVTVRYGTSLSYLRPYFPSFHSLGGLLTKTLIGVYRLTFLCLTTLTIMADSTCYEVSRYVIFSVRFTTVYLRGKKKDYAAVLAL